MHILVQLLPWCSSGKSQSLVYRADLNVAQHVSRVGCCDIRRQSRPIEGHFVSVQYEDPHIKAQLQAVAR